MRVAVVGAGLAGLAAARELRADGHEVVVLEKSRGLGGRLATRWAEGTVLDHGSPVLAAPEGSALRRLADALHADDRVDLDDGLAFAAGATRLPKLMAGGLDVRVDVRIAALRDAGGAFELGDEQGNTHGAVAGVVVTAPAPQAADLLDRSPGGAPRAALVRSLSYAPAVMVLAAVAGGGEGPAVERPAEGPVAELRREAAKGRGGDPAPVVARLTREVSADLLDASDAAVLEVALPALAALVGAEPAWSQVKRWRFAVPEGRLDPDEVNPPDARIVVAGDSVTGASFGGDDHHRVFASGVDAARRLTHALAVAAP
ncbi:MAG TPA: FAD-dependent oxidoreductase [Miltoncostaeaceae bacterium]|nr:FAD-dependent oxidoreductase [Miltoncostaeaceae bacterium]